MNTQKRSILISTIGNLVEWYDWFVYSIFAVYFSSAFFPESTPLTQLIQTAAIFGIGFLMRPLGAWVFGSYGDKYGRKKSMTISILMMCSGSLMIACAPTYETIGIFSPLLLLIARMLQGFSIGGEDGSVAAYLSEEAPPNKRGLYVSCQAVTITMGQMLALGLLIVLQQWVFTTEQLHAFGWRIPFFIGAILAVIGYFLRYNLEETRIFMNQKNKSPEGRGELKTLWQHKIAIVRLFFITIGGTVAYYTYTAYMFKYLINVLHFEKTTATYLSFCNLIILLILLPLLGMLSDKVGRRPLLITFGVLATVCTLPLFTLLEQVETVGMAFLCMLSGIFITSFYSSINSIAKAELFPTEIRALGVSLPAALVTGLFGGTVEYLGLYFQSVGHIDWFYLYVSACAFISLVGCYWMKDPKATSLIR